MAMSILRRGMARLARRKAERRLAVFGCMLLRLPVQRVPSQKRVVLLLFQSIRCARTLPVPRRHVTRNWLAQRFGLGAFQCDNFLRHFLLLYLCRRGRFLFLSLAPFFFGKAEQ